MMKDTLLKFATVGVIATLGTCQMFYAFGATVVSDGRFSEHSTANHLRFSSVDTMIDNLSTATQGKLDGKVNTTDSRLTDARTPTAHTQAASTITGLGAVATTNNYTSLTNKPTIPAAQIKSDWYASGTLAEILNKPPIPEVCGTNPATAVWDGAPGVPALFCNVTGGRRTVFYSGAGDSPTGMSPFSALLYEGSNLVTPLYWSWFTGGASNRIYGTGTSATFTPSVKPLWSNYSSNNYVGAYLTYSSIHGKRAARCYAPVAVSKPGDTGAQGAPGAPGAAATIAVGTVATGNAGSPVIVTNSGTSSAAVFDITIPKGDTGDPGTIDQSQIFQKIDDISTLPLILHGTADTTSKLETHYATTPFGVSLYITSSGLIYALDTAGKLVWGWDNTNKVMKFSSYSTTSGRVNMTIDQKGNMKQYATDGKTLIFSSSTSSRQKRWTRAGKLIEHSEPDGKKTLYKPDGVTPRFTNGTTAVIISKRQPSKKRSWLVMVVKALRGQG